MLTKQKGYLEGQFLFLLIELAFVPIRPEKQSRYPGRSPAHLIAYRLKRYTRAALDNQFVMDAADDEAVSKRLHGVCEDVPRNSLDNVFDELWSVGFDAAPFPGIHTFIGDRLRAEPIHTHLGLHIAQPPA